MSNNQRWIALLGALLLAAMVGFAAYQAGVERGIERSTEQSGKIVVAPPSGANPNPYPYPYPYYGWYYGWHRPWGFGFFFFILFWLLVARSLFWRRAGWYGGAYGGNCGPRHHFDEWHRQAHERWDAGQGTAPGGPGER